MTNSDINKARKEKNNEFYTQLADIEKELIHYKDHFKGKVVYCNCDDPRVSNFFEYFSENFEFLGLKKLITTCYKNQDQRQFSRNDSKQAVYLEYYGDANKNKIVDDAEVGVKSLKGDGDFRSEECIAMLREADIVVTNPPFSLFTEYVAQLIEHKKKFLIIGNMNAVTYKQIFPLIQENKIWFGPSIKSGDREFGVPKSYPLNAVGHRQDEMGNKFIKVKGVRWFTNLDYKQRHNDLFLYKDYSPEDYPEYDNYSAISVDKTTEIPRNHKGAMGVPISFLDKWNPDQFQIVGLCWLLLQGKSEGMFKVNGKRKYRRVVIKHKRRQVK